MAAWGPYRISRTSKLILISNPNYLLLRKKLGRCSWVQEGGLRGESEG